MMYYLEDTKISTKCFDKWDPYTDNDICRISIGKLISKEE